MSEAQKYGTLELAKIENMRTQYEDMAAGRTPQSTDDLDMAEAALDAAAAEETAAVAKPEKKYGFVAVCAGDGLAALFHDLCVDGVVGGGQTMNPSTEDILKEINKTPAEVVYVLPNNKNIIMAAEQCIPLVENKQVIVLPWDPDADVDANTEAMTRALSGVHTSEVTYAARNSDFGGFAIKEGDYLALSEGQLFGTDSDLSALLTQLANDSPQQQAEFLTIYYGEDVTEEQAQQALELFTAACPNAEISLLPGGQPGYYYMISAE